MKERAYITVLALFLVLYIFHETKQFEFPNIRLHYASFNWRRKTSLLGRVDLTIRMPASGTMVQRFFCYLLRSAVVFWNPKYGDVVIILDAPDVNVKSFPGRLNDLTELPFNFRYIYEKSPENIKGFQGLAKATGKPFGYILQLYSFFIMDKYFKEDKIIAYTDTDVTMMIPHTDESIMKDGKLIVKGMNSFKNGWGWMRTWQEVTKKSLGLNQVSDFMTYFPVYLYPHTVRNCREYIMKLYKVTKFEDAFLQFADRYISSVSVVLSYAYYFERESYYWHIDTFPQTLDAYNKEFLPNHPLTQMDIQPEIHTSLHVGYYKSPIDPLEQAICYTQIHIGMKDIPHCKQFVNKTNVQLYEFGNHKVIQNHLQSWLKGDRKVKSEGIILQRYNEVKQQYKHNLLEFRSELIDVVDRYSKRHHKLICRPITYKPFTIQPSKI